jgi:hypothetical protein
MKPNLDSNAARLFAGQGARARQVLWGLLSLILLLPLAQRVDAVVIPPPPGSTNTYTILETWSFNDTTNWTSDKGHAPIAFTNITSSLLGNGPALAVDSTNAAFLRYNVVEQDGTTNLTVDQGSVLFWVAPTSWTGTNAGGTGPGVWGRLIEVGSYTPDASYGFWSLYLDDAGCNLYFSAQGNDGSQTTYLTAPITWDTTNRWHHIALTWSATNSALYLDGALATNGLPVTCLPGPQVLANGFCIGSDTNGVLQAHAMFDDVATYNYPVSSNAVLTSYLLSSIFYIGNPMNRANLAKAPSYLTNTPNFVAIAGPGNLTPLFNPNPCVSGSTVWLTNVVATLVTNGTMNLAFTIAGGWNGLNGPFDVFANALLGPTNNPAYQWAWMGQGYSCGRYVLTNFPFYSAYLILGTPQDSTGGGLTDAYKLLVAHADPNKIDTDGNGMPDTWQVLNLGNIGNDPNGDPDRDGLSNLQEYLFGTNPNISEGTNVWVGEPAIYVSIP